MTPPTTAPASSSSSLPSCCYCDSRHRLEHRDRGQAPPTWNTHHVPLLWPHPDPSRPQQPTLPPNKTDSPAVLRPSQGTPTMPIDDILISSRPPGPRRCLLAPIHLRRATSGAARMRSSQRACGRQDAGHEARGESGRRHGPRGRHQTLDARHASSRDPFRPPPPQSDPARSTTRAERAVCLARAELGRTQATSFESDDKADEWHRQADTLFPPAPRMTRHAKRALPPRPTDPRC